MNSFWCEKLGNIFMEVRAQFYTKFKPIKATCHDPIALQLTQHTYSTIILTFNLLGFYCIFQELERITEKI